MSRGLACMNTSAPRPRRGITGGASATSAASIASCCRPVTITMMCFLSRWARRLSWRETARAFRRLPERMADEREEGMGGGRVAADELRLLIERAERLEEEKKGIQDDIKDVMGEAKSRGYDPKAIRKILSIRKKKKEEYQEEEAILTTYLEALGMI